MPSLLTEEEKVRVRHHLGFLNVQEVETFVLGTPSSVETQFLIEGAFNKLMPTALPKFRQLLATCDQIEEMMICALGNLEANRVGTIELNHQGADNQQRQLQRRYNYFCAALANMLGVIQNPYDKRMLGRSYNVRVQN